MKLVHWWLMGGMLHLVHWGGDWTGPQPALAPPCCNALASPTTWRAACSQFRTLPPYSWREPGDAIIISPVLRQLHWLPVRQHVVFKIATLVYWSLSSNAPGCLADDCQLVAVAGVRQLRSADTRTLVVSRTRSSFEDRTFAAAGPLVWNSMPPNLRLFGLSVSYGQFRRLLKTFLFGQWGHGAVWTVFNCAE